VDEVVAVCDSLGAVVVITDHEGPVGRSLAVRLNGDERATIDGGTIWYPADRLEGLTDLLRGKLTALGGGHG
jgi:hypothetical protein